MSLEDNIAALTVAVKELTAAIKSKAADAPATEPVKTVTEAAGDGSEKKSGKTGGKGSKAAAGNDKQPAVSYAEVSTLIGRLSKEKGRDKAVETLKAFGAKNGKDLKEDQYEEFVALAKAALEEEEDLA